MRTLLEDIQNRNAFEVTNALNKALKEKTLVAIGEARKQVAVEIFGDTTGDGGTGSEINEAREPKKPHSMHYDFKDRGFNYKGTKNGFRHYENSEGHKLKHKFPTEMGNHSFKHSGPTGKTVMHSGNTSDTEIMQHMMQHFPHKSDPKDMKEGEHQEHRRAEAKMPVSAKEKNQKRKEWDDDVRMPWPKDYISGGRKDPGSRAGNSGAAMASHRFAESREVGKISFTDMAEAEANVNEWYGKKRRFARPGSALAAPSKNNPRNLPCPTCKEPNKLTPSDHAKGYQCDNCADRDEGKSFGMEE